MAGLGGFLGLKAPCHCQRLKVMQQTETADCKMYSQCVVSTDSCTLHLIKPISFQNLDTEVHLVTVLNIPAIAKGGEEKLNVEFFCDK